jgi:1-acyl-sn-glycerol-3-phosphate acyltransferase
MPPRADRDHLRPFRKKLRKTMTRASRIVSPLIKWVLHACCRIDSQDLAKVPKKGPLIIVVNHINFLEVPILYTFLFPRKIFGIIKQETWDNFLLGLLADIWEAIPLDRYNSDMSAMRRASEVLNSRVILLIAPEGTRSVNGKLQRGHGGIVPIALRNQAMILPVAHYGGERFWRNLKSLRRTRFYLRVGTPFYLKEPAGKGLKTARAEMTDEIMYQIARLLPPKYRGVYEDMEKATTQYLEFTSP